MGADWSASIMIKLLALEHVPQGGIVENCD